LKPFRFYLIALSIIFCDQVSKYAILNNIQENESISVVGKWFWLTHVHNTGGAFSLFQARNSVFILIAVAAVAALIYAYHNYQRDNLYVSAALALALGGAIGNLIDRIRFGYVVDFFDIRIWPVFNIADSAITIGILFLAVQYLIPSRSHKKQSDVKVGKTTE
jgi:signal peptidase II